MRSCACALASELHQIERILMLVDSRADGNSARDSFWNTEPKLDVASGLPSNRIFLRSSVGINTVSIDQRALAAGRGAKRSREVSRAGCRVEAVVEDARRGKGRPRRVTWAECADAASGARRRSVLLRPARPASRRNAR